MCESLSSSLLVALHVYCVYCGVVMKFINIVCWSSVNCSDSGLQSLDCGTCVSYAIRNILLCLRCYCNYVCAAYYSCYCDPSCVLCVFVFSMSCTMVL